MRQCTISQLAEQFQEGWWSDVERVELIEGDSLKFQIICAARLENRGWCHDVAEIQDMVEGSLIQPLTDPTNNWFHQLIAIISIAISPWVIVALEGLRCTQEW